MVGISLGVRCSIRGADGVARLVRLATHHSFHTSRHSGNIDAHDFPHNVIVHNVSQWYHLIENMVIGTAQAIVTDDIDPDS